MRYFEHFDKILHALLTAEDANAEKSSTFAVAASECKQPGSKSRGGEDTKIN